jgi:hypothetical protein
MIDRRTNDARTRKARQAKSEVEKGGDWWCDGSSTMPVRRKGEKEKRKRILQNHSLHPQVIGGSVVRAVFAFYSTTMGTIQKLLANFALHSLDFQRG